MRIAVGLEPEGPDPGARAARRRMLQTLIGEIVACDFHGMTVLENLPCRLGLDRAARLHGDGGRAILQALHQLRGEGFLLAVAEERAEVLNELVVECLARS